MSSAADQQDLFIGDGIDQEPIQFDVALPNTTPFAGQFVRPVGGWETAMLGEQLNYGDELVHVFTATLLALDVIAKLFALCNPAHEAGSERTNFCRPRRH